MASAAVRHFFHHLSRKTPWYVSPVRVPCQRCAKFDPPYPPSTNCQNQRRFDFTCASRFEDEPESIPEFKEHNEASSIQLFYDLFFVANLSICTSNHPVKDIDSLSTYIGFFTLMWFTWFCTIIFDVRFAIDSWFTRLNKACSFSIMTAFAMSTVFFDTEDEKHFGHEARMMSLILMTSRLFLVMQYVVTMIAVYYRHREESVIIPFALTICTSLVAAFVFLGLSYSNFAEHSYAYVGWYVMSVAEAAVLLIISYYSSDLMKFDDSNIVERMGALTLIILGEGIIGMTEKVSLILKSSSKISAPTLGLVVAAVLIIYVLWMLYFDHADRLDHPGGRINKQKPWCQLWVFLHFPLHTAILITVEGSARFISWWSAIEALNFLDDNFLMYWDYWPYVQNGTQLATGIRLQLDNITGTYPCLGEVVNSTEFQANLTMLRNLGTFNISDNDTTFDPLYNMYDILYVKTCDLFDIDTSSAPGNSDNKIGIIYEAYHDWFVAFFVAAGCVLIILALARCVGHQEASSKTGISFKPGRRGNKRWVAWVAIIMHCLIGIGLALVSLLALPRNDQYSDVWGNFLSSPWIIPTVLLAFSSGKSISINGTCAMTDIPRAVIICDNFLYYWSFGTSSSDILHPPRSEGPPENEELVTYKAETKRLEGMVKDLGADPRPGFLLKPAARRGKASPCSNEFGRDSESPLLKSSLSPQQYELDRMSARTGHLSVTEMPLLKSSLSPPERDSDAVSARTEYSRLTEDPEEGYGA